MKNKQINYSLLVLILVILFSCQKSIDPVVDTPTNPTTPTTTTITTKYPLVLSPNNLLVSIQVPNATFSFANGSYYGIFTYDLASSIILFFLIYLFLSLLTMLPIHPISLME